MNPVTASPAASFADVQGISLDVWASITRYVDDTRDLLALFCACTHMQKAVQRASFLAAPNGALRRWLWHYSGSVDRMFGRVKAVGAEAFFGRVSTLDLSEKQYGRRSQDAIILWVICERLSRWAPQIRTIDLTGCTQIINGHLESISRLFLSIERLHLAHCKNISDDGVRHLIGCNRLASLDLCGCNMITNATMILFSSSCTNLVSLDVSRCPDVNDEGIIPFVKGHPALHSLRLSETAISDATLEALADHCPHLVTLALDFCNVSDVGLSRLTRSPRMWQHLAFAHCQGVGSATLTPFVQQGRELATLSLNHTVADDALLAAIREHCTSLCSLAIGGCALITENGVRDFSTVRHGLLSLDICGREDINTKGIIALLANCPLLRHLNVSASPLTDATLVSIADVCPHLYSIDASDCPHVSSTAIEHLLNTCSMLRSLSVRNVRHISVANIASWLTLRPMLRHIDLGMTRIPGPSIKTLERVHKVTIDYEPTFTVTGYSYFSVHAEEW